MYTHTRIYTLHILIVLSMYTQYTHNVVYMLSMLNKRPERAWTAGPAGCSSCRPRWSAVGSQRITIINMITIMSIKYEYCCYYYY